MLSERTRGIATVPGGSAKGVPGAARRSAARRPLCTPPFPGETDWKKLPSLYRSFSLPPIVGGPAGTQDRERRGTMHTRRLVVAVAALCALFVSVWMLPEVAAAEGIREPARPLA